MNNNILAIIIIALIASISFVLNIYVKKLKNPTTTFACIFIGLLFLLSGFVKAVDPLGSAYKIHDYLEAFNLPWLTPAALVFAILLNIAEFFIGFTILFRIRVNWFAWGALLFMIFFTPLTLYLALKNPVSDCGCFGDFIVLSNWETFYKNIGFLIFTLIVFTNRKAVLPISKSFKTELFISFLGLFFIIGIQLYSLRYDALMDFRPWKIGNNIAEQVVPTMEKSEIKLVYKNNQTGNEELFTAENLPWEDSIRMSNLTFIEQRKTIIEPFKEAPIHDFIISNNDGEDCTANVVAFEDFIFMVVAYDITTTNIEAIEKLNQFSEEILKDSISMVLLTGSSPNQIDEFNKKVKLKFPLYTADPVALKTIIRSNPGVLLLKDGFVIDKWAFRKMIAYKEFKQKVTSYEKQYQELNNKKEK